MNCDICKQEIKFWQPRTFYHELVYHNKCANPRKNNYKITPLFVIVLVIVLAIGGYFVYHMLDAQNKINDYDNKVKCLINNTCPYDYQDNNEIWLLKRLK